MDGNQWYISFLSFYLFALYILKIILNLDDSLLFFLNFFLNWFINLCFLFLLYHFISQNCFRFDLLFFRYLRFLFIYFLFNIYILPLKIIKACWFNWSFFLKYKWFAFMKILLLNFMLIFYGQWLFSLSCHFVSLLCGWCYFFWHDFCLFILMIFLTKYCNNIGFFCILFKFSFFFKD